MLTSLAITDCGTGSSRRLRLRLSLTRKGVHDNGAVEDSHVVLTHRLPNAQDNRESAQRSKYFLNMQINIIYLAGFKNLTMK